MSGLPPQTVGGRPQPANDGAARAGAIAAAIPGVTLGRRLTSFRAARAADRPEPARVDGRDGLANRLAAAVGGSVLEGAGGSVVRLDAGTTRIPVDRQRLGSLPGQPPADRRLVCLDTETTGLGTGAGTVAWIVGVGTWEGDALSVVQLLLPDHPDEPALLDAVAREIGPAPVLVTYNGRSFDWPLLVARYRLHGRPAPELGGHLDLLPTVRRLFRHRLGGARLRTVEEGLLGVARHDDVEGWEIPALYLDFLRGGAAVPLARVARHNAEDIRSLGRLLAHLDASLADPSARPAAHPGDLASLAEMLRLDGRHDEALACLEHAVPPCALTALRSVRADVGGRDPDPDRVPPTGRPGRGGPVEIADVLAARARTLRRLGRHAEAAAAWEDLATVAGSAGAAAWIEVAKIHEHAARDPAGALAATDRALALLARRRAAGRTDVLAEGRAVRRRARLVRRVARVRSTVRTAHA